MPVKVLLFNFLLRIRDRGMLITSASVFPEQQGYDEYFDGPRELDGGNIPAGTSKQYTFRYLVKERNAVSAGQD